MQLDRDFIKSILAAMGTFFCATLIRAHSSSTGFHVFLETYAIAAVVLVLGNTLHRKMLRRSSAYSPSAVAPTASMLKPRSSAKPRPYSLSERMTPKALPKEGEEVQEPSISPSLPAWFILLAGFLPWLVAFLKQGLLPAFAWNLTAEPYELIGLHTLQNLLLVVVLLRPYRRYLRLAVFTNLLLALFCSALVPGLTIATWVYLLTLTQGLIAVWTLMADYWSQVQEHMIGPAYSVRFKLRFSILFTCSCFLGVVGMGAVWASPTPWRLAGWLPSSGGDRWGDERARSGLGDGEQLVAAEHEAFTFGPIESNLFLEDQAPSLYDVMNELFGEARQPKPTEAAVSLSGVRSQMNHAKLSESQAAPREFSVVREQPRKRPGNLEQRPSTAWLHYQGGVPQHLALQSYNRFDGRQWSLDNDNDGQARENPRLEHDLRGKPWIVVHSRKGTIDDPSPLFGAIRYCSWNSPRLASPDRFSKLHIDRVDRPDLFATSEDGMIMMPERTRVPPLTKVVMQYPRRTPQALQEIRAMPAEPGAFPEERWAPAASVAATARAWAGDLPSGRAQIEAITARLQTAFTLDKESSVPSADSDPLVHFLHVQRGPSYLFATTAAVMLRSLGYRTRLVAGIYLDASDFAVHEDAHIAMAENLHWWFQVSDRYGQWFSFEATPGYQPPITDASLWEHLSARIVAWQRWLYAHRWSLLMSLAGLFILMGFRRSVADWLYTRWYTIVGFFWQRNRCCWAFWLLERRASLAGLPRPKHQTPKRWFSALVDCSAGERQAFDFLCESYNQRLFSPAKDCSCHGETDPTLSQALSITVTHWSLRNMRRHRPCPLHAPR